MEHTKQKKKKNVCERGRERTLGSLGFSCYKGVRERAMSFLGTIPIGFVQGKKEKRVGLGFRVQGKVVESPS